MDKTEITQRLIRFRQVVEDGIELPSDEIELALASTLAGVCEALDLDPEQAADVVGYIGYNDTPLPFTQVSTDAARQGILFEPGLVLVGV